ncbi:MAG: glycosyltransferase [Prolixibacteraceae bacterium]|jgi:glycosyltransferase involved in cell wall biosynthesis|nr:glycosyltransferase [Prolixibacteraceae bacterium]MDD4755006.1 glycosyltransferase [Prolixibacteraceae bacterium]NLO00744.1 glycosyltransferase family 4 protein [Bacteroidales bacterium]
MKTNDPGLMDKKITMLTFSLDHGGAEKVCLTLCNEFVRRNYETELWIINYRESSLTVELNSKIKIFNLNRKHVRNSIVPLIKLLVRRRPKRILIFHIELAILIIALKKLLFLKTAVIVRSINTLSRAYDYPSGMWEKYLARPVIKWIIPRSDKIIAQSTGMYRDLIINFNIPIKSLVTIHNPAFNLQVNGAKKMDETVKTKEFLYVGRLSPQKGLVNMVNAFKLAHHANPTIHLTLVGEGSEREKLENLVAESGLKEAVTFTGFRENTLPYFCRARATLLTSFFEGFPNVLVESLMAGTPVIAFDCPSGPEDIIIPGVNGLLIPYLDLEKFSAAILKVAGGELQFSREKIIESSERFSINSIVQQYERVLWETN